MQWMNSMNNPMTAIESNSTRVLQIDCDRAIRGRVPRRRPARR